MSSHITINTGNISNSDDERYEQKLVKRRKEAETRLWEEEEQQRAEQRARKKKEYQRNLAHQLEVDCVAAVEQQQHKNWTKTFLSSSPPSNKDMNLIDLPPLTKRQHIRYLPQETPEAHQ